MPARRHHVNLPDPRPISQSFLHVRVLGKPRAGSPGGCSPSPDFFGELHQPERAAFFRCIHKTLTRCFQKSDSAGDTLHFSLNQPGTLVTSRPDAPRTFRSRKITDELRERRFLRLEITPDRVDSLPPDPPASRPPLNRTSPPSLLLRCRALGHALQPHGAAGFTRWRHRLGKCLLAVVAGAAGSAFCSSCDAVRRSSGLSVLAVASPRWGLKSCCCCVSRRLRLVYQHSPS